MYEASSTAKQTTPMQVIIFGAGNAGRAAISNLAGIYQVIAFCDNNTSCQGSTIDDIPVVAPDHIRTLEFDKILIASEYFEQIRAQLINDLAISSERVEVLPATQMKAMHFGHDSQTNTIAVRILHEVCAALSQHQINYYVDAGTLLGIYRDNALIPWDDDLDLSVLSHEIVQVNEIIGELLPKLKDLTGVLWQLTTYMAEKPFGAVRQGDIRSLKLAPLESNDTFPQMDFFVKYVAGDQMDYTLSSRGISMPSKHAFNTVEHEFAGAIVLLPSDVEGYLERHYGDWRTPKKDWNLSDLRNATVFTKETRG